MLAELWFVAVVRSVELVTVFCSSPTTGFRYGLSRFPAQKSLCLAGFIRIRDFAFYNVVRRWLRGRLSCCLPSEGFEGSHVVLKDVRKMLWLRSMEVSRNVRKTSWLRTMEVSRNVRIGIESYGNVRNVVP